MKKILIYLINIFLFISCNKKQASFEMYQDVIHTVIETDSLIKKHSLSYQLERIKLYKLEKTMTEEANPPNINEIEVSHVLDKFNSANRSQDSLFLISQVHKKCYFVIAENLTSNFSGETGQWYSFYDLIFSENLKKVNCIYTLHCGNNCVETKRIFLEQYEDKWKIINKEDAYLEF